MNNLAVIVDGDQSTRTVVKTTPSMSLRAIVDEVAAKRGRCADDYVLRYNKQLLDLALSVRFAGLPSGAKLDMICRTGAAAPKNHEQGASTSASSLTASTSSGNTSKSPPPLIKVALQLEEGGRVMGSFQADVSLWQLLEEFERGSGGTLCLTRRTAKPGQVASSGKEQSGLKKMLGKLASVGHRKDGEVYVQPVCVIMNREFSAVSILQQTTLRAAGITSGSVLIRLLFKETALSLEESVPAETTCFAVEPKTAVKAAAKSNITADLAVAAVVSDVPTVDVAPTSPSVTIPASQVPLVETPDQVSHERQSQSNIPVEAPSIATPTTTTMTRNPVVYLPPANDTAPSNHIPLPDSFFKLTPLELKAVLADSAARRHAMDNRPLMTKAMREREELEKMRKVPRTLLRIRFADMYQLQGEFATEELLEAVYAFVGEHLMPEMRQQNFYLYTTPPLRRYDMTDDRALNLFKAGWAPASVVYVGCAGAQPMHGKTALRRDLLHAAIELPVNARTSDSSTTNMDVDDEQEAEEEKDNSTGRATPPAQSSRRHPDLHHRARHRNGFACP